MTPTIVITKVNNFYDMKVVGKFGGGYHVHEKTKEEVVSMLATAGRDYDCGKDPIVVVAPEEIKEAAGINDEKDIVASLRMPRVLHTLIKIQAQNNCRTWTQELVYQMQKIYIKKGESF